MKNLASFVISGYTRALAVVTGFTFLSLMLPAVGMLSGGALALVTLKMGWRWAVTLALSGGGLLLAAVSVLIATESWQAGYKPVFAVLLLEWLPVMVLALVLRRWGALTPALHLALLVGVTAVLGVALFFPGAEDWWRAVLEPFLQHLSLALKQGPAIEEALTALPAVMTGIAVSSLMLAWLLMLLLGRWWQSLLDEPGRFRDEFISLRLGRGLAAATLMVFILSMQTDAPLLTQLFAVTMPVFMLQGLATAHAAAMNLERRRLWLAAFYAAMLLILITMPSLLQILVLIGVSESFIDLRRRLADRSE